MITSNTELKIKLKQMYPEYNINRLPAVKSVVVHIGVGQIKDDNEAIAYAQSVLANITGQKAVPCLAKKSISNFKIRRGSVIGYKTTLRNKRAFDFLNKLFMTALPRIRDFRGLPSSSLNGTTLNIGLKEDTVFPEFVHKNTSRSVGLQVSVTLNSPDPNLVRPALELIGAKFA